MLARMLIIYFFSALPVSAEMITATDGRKFELSADGTYKQVLDDAAEVSGLIPQEAYFEHHAGQYNQNSIRFMPIVKNESEKVVVGYRFKTTFESAFGDEIFTFSGESSERIGAGDTSTANTFYYWEDNQFIGNQPYDKLKIFNSNKTGTITTSVTAVVYDDGSLWKAE